MNVIPPPPLQVNMESDDVLESKLCSKGCKGACLLVAASSTCSWLLAGGNMVQPCTPSGMREPIRQTSFSSSFCDFCAVVEIFSEWAGPCKSVLPTFRRIRIDKDDEAALLFMTVGRALLPLDPCWPPAPPP